MSKLSIYRTTTGKIGRLFIQDTSKSDGSGLTGLVYNAAGLTAYYCREGDATATAITLTAGTVGTWSSGGFVAMDAINMPGWYEIGLPNAVFASGNSVALHLKGATNMAPTPLEFQVDALNYQDGVRAGLTAFPNAVAGANGGLPLGDASGNVGLKAGAIDTTNYTPAARTLLYRAYLVLGQNGATGLTVGDYYPTSGLYNNGTSTIAYYQSATLGTPVYVWTDGIYWYMTTTTPGATLPAAYFKTASGATTSGPYTAQGTATGAPSIVAHGNSILSGFQPDVTLPTDTTIQNDVQAALTTQGYTTTRAGYLDTLNGLVAAIWDTLTSATRTAGSYGAKLKAWVLGTDNKALLSTDAGNTAQLPTTPPAGYGGGTAADMWAYPTSAETTAGTYGVLVKNNLDAQVSTRLATSGYTVPPTPPTAVAIRTEIDTNSTQLAAIVASLAVANGLLGLNQGVRNFVYTGSVLNSYDVCTYDTAGHAVTNDGASGLIHKHTVLLTYTSGNQTGQTTQQIS